jgi:cytochrome c oxidase subunit I
MTGRMYPENLAKLAGVVIFIGFFFTFGPQFILGYLGMPRRYASYPPEWQALNVFSTAGATVMAFGYMLTAIYLLWSLKYGEIAGPNPWKAAGLEWQTDSPPITHNFAQVPIVDHEAYNYGEIDAGTAAVERV